MTFALSTKPYSCWTCHHFEPVDRSQSLEGWCRKYAPTGRDLYGPCEACHILDEKGDILTHDGSDTIRMEVGTDGQVLTADSTATEGIAWKDTTGGDSPLTTKGDVYTYDTDDQRLPVGTDGQVLTANSGETTGLKWADLVAFDPYVAHETLEPEQTVSVASWTQFLRCTFDAESGVRYKIEFYFEMKAPIDQDIDGRVQINDTDTICEACFKDLSAFADRWNDGTGGHYITSSLSGTVNVDVDFFNAYGVDDKYARRIRILVTRCDSMSSVIAAAMAKAASESEDPFLGSINPDDITHEQSFAKWCLIRVAPNEWCGEYKANPNDVPDPPDIPWPEPS